MRAFELFVDAARFGAEGQVTPALVRAGKLRDGIGRGLQVGKQVEPLRHAAFVATPGMTRQHRQGLQAHQRFERAAGLIEDLVEDPAHREDRGAGIDERTVDFDLAHLAARLRRRFH